MSGRLTFFGENIMPILVKEYQKKAKDFVLQLGDKVGII